MPLQVLGQGQNANVFFFAQSKSNSKWQMAEMNSRRKPLFNFIRI
jgi:hypothetical protein